MSDDKNNPSLLEQAKAILSDREGEDADLLLKAHARGEKTANGVAPTDNNLLAAILECANANAKMSAMQTALLVRLVDLEEKAGAENTDALVEKLAGGGATGKPPQAPQDDGGGGRPPFFLISADSVNGSPNPFPVVWRVGVSYLDKKFRNNPARDGYISGFWPVDNYWKIVDRADALTFDCYIGAAKYEARLRRSWFFLLMRLRGQKPKTFFSHSRDDGLAHIDAEGNVVWRTKKEWREFQARLAASPPPAAKKLSLALANKHEGGFATGPDAGATDMRRAQ